MTTRRLLSLSVAALAALATLQPLGAAAQGTGPIKVLVGFPAGGSADILARLVADELQTSTGRAVLVENKPGAAGRVALGELKRANPDGQTLMVVPYGTLVVLPHIFKNVAYDQARDFAPIARLATFGFAVTAGPMLPKGDLKDAIGWVRDHPDKANYATSGAGTPMHFTGLLFAQAAGVTLHHVPYKGGAPAAQDLLAGVVPLMIDTPTETLEQHRAGKLRILATTGAQREKTLPDVPTLREAGLNLPPIEGWFGLYAPAGLPADDVARLNQALATIMRKQAVQDRLQSLGLVANHADSAALAAIQAADFKRWEGPIKASGFTAE